MRSDRRLLLIRHGEVEPRWRSACYGHADVGLSPDGQAQSLAVVRRLADEPVTEVMSSGLRRTWFLAERLARQHGLVPTTCPALRERDFGAWELRTWLDIYAETGDAMDGMLTAPATWRPPKGETTFELRDRVLGWYARLPPNGCIVAVTHGGAFAALLGTMLELPVAAWPSLIPAWGEMIEIPPRYESEETPP